MHGRMKGAVALTMIALLAGTLGSIPAGANHRQRGHIHSKNFRKIGGKPIRIEKGVHAEGSDLAFQRRLIVAGAYEGIGFFRIHKRKPRIRQISFFNCPGSQGDVSIQGDYLFVSIDSPSSNDHKSKRCNNTDTNRSGSSLEKEGIRIVDISNLRRPRQVGFIETDCGSHTHTLIPKRRFTYMYVASYPIQQSPSCNQLTHRKWSVIKFPKDHPKRAKIVSTPPTGNPESIGCHDFGVLPKRDLAAAACLGVSMILDISRPAHPEILSRIRNPLAELDHSGGITWDGKVAVFSDEHAGAAGGGGCSTDQDSPVGAMWFYDIRDPRNPVEMGHYSLPRVPRVDEPDEAESFRCTTHNWNILPMRKRGKYVIVSSFYQGGISVVNFSDPSDPKEIGYYLPVINGQLPDMWSAYWYNGRIITNEHASKLGVSSFRMEGLGRKRVRFFKGRLNPQTMLNRFQRRR